jgi:hypothetical protein
MITHSRVIMTVLLVDMLALLMYNVSGMCVTGEFTAQISSCGSDAHCVPGNLPSECSPVDTTVSALTHSAFLSHQAWRACGITENRRVQLKPCRTSRSGVPHSAGDHTDAVRVAGRPECSVCCRQLPPVVCMYAPTASMQVCLDQNTIHQSGPLFFRWTYCCSIHRWALASWESRGLGSP